MNRETAKKIKATKALQGKSVVDVCMLPEFLQNLYVYVEAQREDRKAARASYAAIRKSGAGQGLKLPSHCIDETLNWSIEKWRDEYVAVLFNKSVQSKRLRDYVGQLGTQAYHLTVAQFVVKEFPELEGELLPKKS